MLDTIVPVSPRTNGCPEKPGAPHRQQFGYLSAGAARGLALRHDHDSTFTADHFQTQVRFWSISPSDTFVAEPETNGVTERLFRTFKEQVVHGRVSQTIDEVREAVREFAARSNAEWLIEKNASLSLPGARAAQLDTNLRRAAQRNQVSREPGAVQ
jgi:hypothetical protein